MNYSAGLGIVLNTSMSKKKINSDLILKIFFVLFFAGLGFASAYYQIKYFDKLSVSYYLYTFFIILVSIPLHVLLHELGHLIAGLLSGYEFIMFRLFNYLWIKTEEGLSRRKQYIPGVLGQALMVPPEARDRKDPPILLYHMGGLLLNGLTAIFFILLGRGILNPFTRYFFYLSAAVALFLLLINALPFKGTDGYNIMRYLKGEEQEDVLTTILYIYRDMVKGFSFQNLQDRINLDELNNFEDPNTATFYSLHAAAYLESYHFEKACALYKILWSKMDQLFEGHKAEVSATYLFTLLLTDPSHPDVEIIRQSALYKSYTKIKQVDNFRISASIAIYLENDYDKAEKFLQQAEKEIQYAPTVSDENLEHLLYQYLKKELSLKKENKN